MPMRGGRMKGGQVLDVVLYDPMPVVIEYNEEYWHRDAGDEFLDTAEIIQDYGREPIIFWGDRCKTFADMRAEALRLVGRPA